MPQTTAVASGRCPSAPAPVSSRRPSSGGGAATGGVGRPAGAARDGGSERAVWVAAGFVTMVIMGGGAPRDGGSARTASVDAGPVDLTLVDTAGFEARREAGSERAGGTAAAPASGTTRAGA